MSKGLPDLKTTISSSVLLVLPGWPGKPWVSFASSCTTSKPGVHCVQDLLEGQLDLQEKAVGFSNVCKINPHPDRARILDIHEWH